MRDRGCDNGVMNEAHVDDPLGGATSDRTLESVAVYSAMADEYERAHAAKRAAEVARFAQSLKTPSLVLDAGCGPGRDLARLAAHGHVARGVELNPYFVTRARRHAPVVQMDLRDIASFPGQFFDGVWAGASLVHLPTPQAEAVIRGFAHILRDAGKLFVSVRTEGPHGWVTESDGRRWYSIWSAGDLSRAASDAGFSIDELVPGPYTQLWATRDAQS
jgi:SAM-dependent methyltransferase